MRIGIDAHFASYELRGIGKYVCQLVSRLIQTGGGVGHQYAKDDRNPNENEYVIYGDPRAFPESTAGGRVRFRDPGSLPYPLWEQSVLPVWTYQDRLEILHCPANTAPLACPSGVKLVITIHDVMYLLPSAVLAASRVPRQQLGRFYRRMVVPRVARRADRIITVSEFSKQEVVEYLAIPPDRIRVIHEGVNPCFAARAGAPPLPPKELEGARLDSPFILTLGADDPRKNTLAAIRAYASRWREFPQQERLVIVGLRDWRSSAAYRLVGEMGLSDRVWFAGYVPEEVLAWMYASARCFLYPTRYEGFGFPVLEAMACGAPVIASEGTSVSEIAGGAAILVNPSSEKSIGAALVRLLGDEALRRELIERGSAQARKFDWHKTVEQTLGVYAELAAASGRRAFVGQGSAR